MYCVGLTGNIASGKSTVADLFEQQGAAIISADAIARQLTTLHAPAYEAIREHFGESIFHASGELHRNALRQIIFQDEKAKMWLESLLHPLIRQKITAQIKIISAPYCIIEIPLLKSKSDYPYLNRVLLVTSPLEQQIARVVARDKASIEEATAILATQPSLKERYALADDVIFNDGSIETLLKAIVRLHVKYLGFAAQQE